MAETTAIAWTDHTFNPWQGCERVSSACDHCYAATISKRVGHPERWDGARDATSAGYWRNPLRWDRKAAERGRPGLVFCGSMCDVFEDRPDLDEHRARLWELIVATPHLIWLLLTKRPEQIMRRVPLCWRPPTCHGGWPSNVWVGTTVEDQERANERIPHLLDVPAPVRFLSVEPMLGPVDLDHWLPPFVGEDAPLGWVNWVICGGESGHGARPMHPDWARDLRDQCAAARVPFFFKQWGEFSPDKPEGRSVPVAIGPADPAISFAVVMHRVGTKAAGHLLDGVEHHAWPAEARR